MKNIINFEEIFNSAKSYGFKPTKDEKLKEFIMEALRKREGFCPCKILSMVISPGDAICPCRELREHGKCSCRLFIPIKEDKNDRSKS